ncbi:MAG: nucleotide exchange factor GrpE [Bacteroidales bacterium]|nr:nucleotide exchange factor GrpE [Bacteroidales bacterium]MBN2818118.1 nucleotide exchange factor GrpE [Bacteroidales bacterium]
MTKKASKKPDNKTVADNNEAKNTKTATTKTQADKNTQDNDKQTETQSEDQKHIDTKELKTLKDQVEELEKKVSDAEEASKSWNDKYLRLSAEFDNYRKRTLKEKTELTKQANGELLKDILPVVDDFERGLANIDKAEDMNSFKKGIELIYNKFVEFLRQNSVKEIDAKEKDFDIDFHEALTKIPAPNDDLKGKVVDVIEKGYLLNDKVIRYAKVVVGE